MAQVYTPDRMRFIAATVAGEEVVDRRLCKELCRSYGTARCQCPGPIVPDGGVCEGFDINAADFIEAEELIKAFRNRALLAQAA
jgi:hypothetical protein